MRSELTEFSTRKVDPVTTLRAEAEPKRTLKKASRTVDEVV
jgi:hypothetical protein